ncbi:MAG: hypothetical protein SVZ03_10680 [Spirochaetota bacterium]|nr:hypothetical protein [Spirochaetota bacterium]
MGISKKETELLLLKLRNKFNDYAKEYSSKWFNIKDFEERLELAKRNKMNLEGFILAEIANLEKIKEKFGSQKEENSFTQLVDKKIEENVERINKYPEIRFHPLAGYEISRFYGAISQFAVCYFPVLWLLVKGDLRERLHQLEETFRYLAVPRGSKPSKRIDDHILVLIRKNVPEIEVEKDRNEYLKESAFLLHQVVQLLEQLLANRDSEWENPLTFEKLFIEGDNKRIIINNFSGLTGYGAMLMMKDIALQIINDFRLGAFKKKGSSAYNRMR